MDHRFPPQLRIRAKAEFDRVYARREFVVDDCLVVRACENGLEFPRLGMAVSRKVGGAVLRNRWKRLLREAFRLERDRLPPGIDLVVSPRKGASPEARAIRESLPRLARRLAGRLRRRM